jgi:uncharacterized protein (TIGR03086 family)
MDNLLDLFLAGQRAFGDRVHGVAEDQWQSATPASEWTVADLVSHLVDEHRWAAPLLHGHDLATAGKIVQGTRGLPVDGGVGANLAEEWDEAAVGSADAFSADGALDRTVELSRGTTPVGAYITEMIFDLVVHAWDLGTAIGYDEELPADLVEATYAVAQDFDFSQFGDMFAAPVDVPDDASTLDKLIARTGRNPR